MPACLSFFGILGTRSLKRIVHRKIPEVHDLILDVCNTVMEEDLLT